jgi:TolB-like protein
VFAEKSIAVLPFVNMSGDADNEYFSDGLTEELLNVLARIEGLKVAARTSSFHFKGQSGNMGDIARQLGVAHLLEGSVRRSGDRVRVTAQLINPADGFHLWSETYDRQLTDIFAIQDDIARAIGNELKVRVLGQGEQLGGGQRHDERRGARSLPARARRNGRSAKKMHFLLRSTRSSARLRSIRASRRPGAASR